MHRIFSKYILIFAIASISLGANASLMTQWFPQIQWKCLPKKFDDNKNTYWDGECRSMQNASIPSWRLTISDSKWSTKIGEKITGEVLFISLKSPVLLAPNIFIKQNRQKKEIWYSTRANNLSTYFIGGISLMSLRPHKNFPAIKIYGLGMGIGLQSNRNLDVDFKYLPGQNLDSDVKANVRTVLK